MSGAIHMNAIEWKHRIVTRWSTYITIPKTTWLLQWNSERDTGLVQYPHPLGKRTTRLAFGKHCGFVHITTLLIKLQLQTLKHTCITYVTAAPIDTWRPFTTLINQNSSGLFRCTLDKYSFPWVKVLCLFDLIICPRIPPYAGILTHHYLPPLLQL